jgi:spore photoproduct lyase
MATFATKIVPVDFLDFDPQGKVRIRFSIMPQTIADILEPNTAKIIDRIKAIDAFIEAGYDVHVNFSPVVYYRQWLNDYRELFEMLDHYIDDVNKSQVLAEVIFLTHNKKKHEYNLENDIDGEGLMWVPTLQETKKSQYGGENIRYKIHVKVEMIDQWTKLHDELIPWNKIRYIF